MSDVAIRVVGLSKRYQIAPGGVRARYQTLQEDLMALPRRLLSATRGAGETRESFWALKDVSFDVKQGEVLGVIGRNGAGKSTLLKILSRITEPTRGQAELYGRVGSLLEVGTGFHPELTGRENIYLSGAILGMTRGEVQRKFDEIVAFADVERFIDTPAKHFSSGMYMRLAFAVAAHLEPEILLVDEVLAVGDAEFQKKCLGKMKDVAREGRTVLFVSHNLAAIQRLCGSAILLMRGHLSYEGIAATAVRKYMESSQAIQVERTTRQPRQHSSELQLGACLVRSSSERTPTLLSYTQPGEIEIDFEVFSTVQRAQLVFELWHAEYGCVLCSTSLDGPAAPISFAPGKHRAVALVPPHLLRPGTYSVTISASIPGVQMLDEVREAATFEVIDDGSPIAILAQGRRGAVLPIMQWFIDRPEGWDQP